MVQERTTGGAGLRPAVPPHATAPTPPAVPPSESAPAAPEPPALSGAIPAAEQPLDPRAIARASLAAARNASLWWVSAGIVVAIAVSLVVGTRAGCFALAAVAAACGIVRWVSPAPGPVALSVRTRWLDVTVLPTFAIGLAVLAQLGRAGS